MERHYRLILFTILLIAAVAGASAQLRYGFRLGGDFADCSLKDAGNASLINRSGFSGGMALEYQFPGNGFAPDIAVTYTRRNSRLNDAAAPVSFGRNFIEVPLHLKYKFWLHSFHDLVAPMVYCGPSMSIRLDHGHASPLATKRMQPGLDVGIGVDIVNFIQITGGYRFGLGNAAKGFSGCPDASLRTNSWQVAATLLFDF